jgi:hypothetical protein
MPAAALRTPEAEAFRQRVQDESEGFWGDIGRGAKGVGVVAGGVFDAATGLVSVARDPDNPWAWAMAVPVGGRFVRGAKAGASLAAKGAKKGGRAFTHGGLTARAPEAGSRTGRVVEGAIDAARPVLSRTGAVRTEAGRVGYETGISLDIARRAADAPAEYLRRLGKRLNLAEQTALRVIGEEIPIAERIAHHRKLAAEARRAGDKAEAIFHETHISLLEKARRYVDDAGDGVGFVNNAGSRKVREAYEELERVAGNREDVYRRLGELTDDAIRARKSGPGRVIKGARWQRLTLAETGNARPGMWVRAVDQNNYGKILEVDGDSALVHFVNKAEGTEAKVRLPLGVLLDPKAGKIKGAEDFAGGRLRVPYDQGAPGVSVRNPSSYVRGTRQLFAGGRRRAIGHGPQDPTLKKSFKGGGLLSGYFKSDVTGAAARDLETANRLAVVRDARDRLLKASTETPQAADDIAIRTDLLPRGRRLPDELHRVWDAMAAGDVSVDDLARLDQNAAAQLVDHYFPNFRTGVLNAADEEIAGIRWVARDLVEESGLLNVPQAAAIIKKGWHRIARGGGKAALAGVDAFNEINKAVVLWLNPAYPVVQFIQNEAMRFVKQGFLGLRELPKGAWLSHSLGRYEASFVDNMMGHGFSGAAATFSPKSIARSLGAFHHAAADLAPRRAAWLYHARKAGYDTPEKLRGLIRNADRNMGVIEDITRKGLDDIGDFSRLGPNEKAILTRMIWFYPWLKTSTRWTARMAFDNPLKAGALAYASYYVTQNHPPGDVRSEWIAKIPGVPDEWGYVNTGALMPWSFPVEMAQTAYGFATGNPSMPNVIESLTPLAHDAIVASTGYDPYSGFPTGETGADALWAQFSEDIPIRRRIESFLEDDKSRYLRPFSDTQEGLRIGFGQLVPGPYNEEIGRERQLRSASKKDKAKAEYEETVAELDLWLQQGGITQQQYDEILAEMQQSEGGDDGDADRQFLIQWAKDEGWTLAQLNAALEDQGLKKATQGELGG